MSKARRQLLDLPSKLNDEPIIITRIIYKVEVDKVLVLVVGVGLPKEGDKGDIYALIEKLLDE